MANYTAKQLFIDATNVFASIVEEMPNNDKPALREALNDQADHICRQYSLLDLREQIEYGNEIEIERSVVHSELYRFENFNDLENAIHSECCEHHPK